MNASFEAVLFDLNGNTRSYVPQVEEKRGIYRINVPTEAFRDFPCEKVEIHTPLTRTQGGKGSLIYPTDAARGIVRTDLSVKHENSSYSSCISAMPFGGITDLPEAVFFYVTGQDCDAFINVSCSNENYEIFPAFQLDGDLPDEDLTVWYVLMPHADYSAMAKVYREYQIKEKKCVPLLERIRNNDILKKAADCIEIRIRMGWKPSPTNVPHQTPENEPEMKVACRYADIDRLIERIHELGVDKAEICLVGWGTGGHDGRFPQQLPPDPRYGSEDELHALIQKAKAYGYLIVCHVVTTAAFEIAENWDADLLGYEKMKDGSIRPMLRGTYVNGGLSGGLPYSLCAKTSFEHYVTKDFPRIRDFGFEGLFYDDVLTIIKPDKCYHPDHPVSRKMAQEYYRKIACLSRKLFGGFQSEGWFDFMNSDVDYVLYTSFKSRIGHQEHPLFDEGIPFWQLVYHGIVMSNATSETVNYPIKPEDEHLRVLEWGSRPLMYVYSKFGDKKNWMGDLDLRTGTPEEMEKSAQAIYQAYKEYEQMKHLQLLYIDRHDQLADGIYQTVYSDGTTVTVDYNKKTFRFR